MSPWTFVIAAYALVYGVLLVYAWRVERGLRVLDAAPARAGRSARA